jgi:hypothetical protein
MSATDFCATGGHASTNHGDSGGPVMIRAGGTWRLAGLVDLDSSGSPTDDSPPFFEDMTSIARELPWINTVVDTGAPARSLGVDPSSFGGMPNPSTLRRAIDRFGQPTVMRSDGSAVDCAVRWDDLGIRALFQDFGATGTVACRPEASYTLSYAFLSGPRWVTDRGVRLGDPLATLTHAYPHAVHPVACSTDSQMGPEWWQLASVADPLGGPGSYICTLAARVQRGIVTEFELSSTAASE